MTTIVTRAGKGSPLTWNEVDTNFTNLNSAKYESGNNAAFGTLSSTGNSYFATSSGNVGIGTIYPSSKLEVNGDTVTSRTSGIPIIKIWSNQATGYYPSQLLLHRTGASSTATPDNSVLGEIRFDGLNTAVSYDNAAFISVTSGVNAAGGMPSYMSFGTASSGSAATERMRLDSSGNLGIGTSNPTAKLQIGSLSGSNATYVGDIQINAQPTSLAQVGGLEFKTSTFGSGYGWKISSIDSSGIQLVFGTRQNSATWTEAMRIDSSGNVGIGTIPYTTGFVLGKTTSGLVYSDWANYSNTNATDGVDLRLITQNVAGSGTTSVDIVKTKSGAFTIYNNESNSAAYTAFGINNTERMRITSTGNVGINTSSPYGTFEVANGGATSSASASTYPNIQISQASSTINSNGGLDFKGSTYGSGYGWRLSAVDSTGVHLVFGNRQNSTTYTEAMRIDASNNVGIGVSSPSYKLDVSGDIRFSSNLIMTASTPTIIKNANSRVDVPTGGSSGSGYGFWTGYHWAAPESIVKSGQTIFPRVSDFWEYNSPTNPSYINYYSLLGNASGGGQTLAANYVIGIDASSTGSVTFLTAGNERMRIDNSGRVIIGGTSSSNKFSVFGNSSTETPVYINDAATASGSQFLFYFIRNGSYVGSIQTTLTATTYVSASDYRLKENVQPMVGALDKVSKLNPVTYTWKKTGEEGQGFIAHELQAVVPDCVTGEKDAVDNNGNPVYQGIDTSFLVATLTKAIQEQQELIKQLQADVALLKGK